MTTATLTRSDVYALLPAISRQYRGAWCDCLVTVWPEGPHGKQVSGYGIAHADREAEVDAIDDVLRQLQLAP